MTAPPLARAAALADAVRRRALAELEARRAAAALRAARDAVSKPAPVQPIPQNPRR